MSKILFLNTHFLTFPFASRFLTVTYNISAVWRTRLFIIDTWYQRLNLNISYVWINHLRFMLLVYRHLYTYSSVTCTQVFILSKRNKNKCHLITPYMHNHLLAFIVCDAHIFCVVEHLAENNAHSQTWMILQFTITTIKGFFK